MIDQKGLFIRRVLGTSHICITMSHSELGADDRIGCFWKQAVSEYLELVQLSKPDAEWLARIKASSKVVSNVIEAQNAEKVDQSGNFSQKMFIAAVISAGTHHELVGNIEILKGERVPTIVSNQVATFLRYSSAIDAFLEAMGNTTFASAFVFGAVRFMLAVAAKNLKLLTAIHEKFVEVDERLRRLDVYLCLSEPSEAVRLMCIRVLVNVLRFYGLATRYFSSKSRAIDR